MTTKNDEFGAAFDTSVWDVVTGSFVTFSGDVYGPFAALGVALRKTSDHTFGNDGYVECDYTTKDNAGIVGICARGAAGSGNYYAFEYAGAPGSSAVLRLSKYTANVQSTLASYDWGGAFTGLTNNDAIRFEYTGTGLVGKLNGSTVVSTTDSSYASGQPGFLLFKDNSGLDAWEASDGAAAAKAAAAYYASLIGMGI